MENPKSIVKTTIKLGHAPISKLELALCTAFFLSIFAYGIFNVWELSAELRQSVDTSSPEMIPFGLKEGILFSSLREYTELEWKAIETIHLPVILPLMALNALLTWILHACKMLKFRKWTALAMGIYTTTKIIGYPNTGVVFGAIAISLYGIRYIHPVAFPWLLSLAMIAGGAEKVIQKSKRYDNVGYVMAFWMFAWNLLRIISFGHEMHRRRKAAAMKKKDDDTKAAPEDLPQMTYGLIDLLSFNFYPPTLLGPIVSYPHYYGAVIDPRSSNNFEMSFFMRKLATVAAWLFGLVLIKEFFYISIMSLDLEFADELNGFGKSVLTWTLGQNFQAKYMVLYGIPFVAAYLDRGVLLTPLPAFISRIYLYSMMWKHFDTGLYDFMKRYIYIPLGGSKRPLVSSVVVFGFIYVWHGLRWEIALWTVLNFLQVALETIVRALLASESDNLLKRLRASVSASNWRRLTALACAFSFQLSHIAIGFFLTDWDCGLFMAKAAILNVKINYIVHLMVVYCWIQACFSLENYESGHPL